MTFDERQADHYGNAAVFMRLLRHRPPDSGLQRLTLRRMPGWRWRHRRQWLRRRRWLLPPRPTVPLLGPSASAPIPPVALALLPTPCHTGGDSAEQPPAVATTAIGKIIKRKLMPIPCLVVDGPAALR